MNEKLLFVYSKLILFITYCIINLSILCSQEFPNAEIDTVLMIWDEESHNAFTTLVEYNNTFYCAFRSGEIHLWDSTSSVIVLSSTDGLHWSHKAVIPSEIISQPDIRDPGLSITPDNRLMVSAGIASLDGSIYSTIVSFSDDGSTWSEQIKVGTDFMWIWKPSWFESKAYGVGYPAGYSNPGPYHIIRLYEGIYNNDFYFISYLDTLYFNSNYPEISSPNESKLLFLNDSSAVCLSRRNTNGALLGYAYFPYHSWAWHDTETQVGGPNMIQLPTGPILVAARLYDGKQRTSLLWLNLESNTLVEFLELPSGGDTGYPGLLFKGGKLYVSYYSSHEIGTNIYLAIIDFPEVIEDCNRIWGGNAQLDECGVCNGAGAIYDCGCEDITEFTCDCNGNVLDECGICGGDNSCLSMNNLIVTKNYSITNIYPNPFNPTTTIDYGISRNSMVQILVYDLYGNLVVNLLNDFQTVGHHTINWNASSYPSGIYFVKMKSGVFTETKKLLLVK